MFACLFGAGLLGVRVRAALPEDHLSSETKDAVKVGMGLVATMAALVLGLLVASTKGSYDTQKNEVTQMAAKTVFLDRVLANYGSESAESRDLLRRLGRECDQSHVAGQEVISSCATGSKRFLGRGVL